MFASLLHPVKGHPGLPFEVRGLKGAGTEQSPISPHLPHAACRCCETLAAPSPQLPRELSLSEGLCSVNILRQPCPWGQKLWEWGGEEVAAPPGPLRLPTPVPPTKLPP